MFRQRVFLAFGLYLLLIVSQKVSADEKSVKLSSGYDMPIVGLGTWKVLPEQMDTVINAALEKGYRHIDTATVYENEKAIGDSLKKWYAKGGKREDLFITTKLPVFGNRASDVEKFLNMSLENLGTDYVDMYLIHGPYSIVQDPNNLAAAKNEDGSVKLDLQADHKSTWIEMEKQVQKGRARSIGLSNFNESQVDNIHKNAKIKPSNLQVELHAYMQQKPLREFCKKNNIALTAYSPLGSPGNKNLFRTRYNYETPNLPDLLTIDPVKKIAANHKKSPAQILLRHSLQHGNVVIPKSTNPERIRQNFEIFDFTLSDAEMKILDDLDKGTDGRMFNFLFYKDIEKHPYYPFAGELKPGKTR